MRFIPCGIIIPVITPVDREGRFNEPAYRKLLAYWHDNGIHGVFPFGTTGEFYAFSDETFERMLAVTVENSHGMTVYAGANHITPDGVLKLARIAERVGANALSVLTPMFVSQTQSEIYNYYRRIAEGTPLPIIVYNNRPKTNVHVAPETVARLAEIPNILGVKDSTGDMTNAEEYIRLTRHRDDFHVLMGRDTMIYAALCYGATGAITSCANVAPRIAADIYDCFQAGDHKGALEAQFKLASLRIATNMGTFPVVIKEALEMLGYETGPCLPPIEPLEPQQRDALRKVLEEMGLLTKEREAFPVRGAGL